MCAFNKRIAEELNTRLEGTHAEAKTLHALGYQMVRRQWRGMPVARPASLRQDQLTDAALKETERQQGEKTPWPIRRLITQLHTKAREMRPLDTTQQDLEYLALQFGLVPDEGWRNYDLDYVVLHALSAMYHAATEEPTYDVGIDYADMIFLPLAWNLTSRDYRLVVVDEAQDMTMAQLELARRSCDGRLCIVGDDRQAIYGFRGADSNSLDRLKRELGALELPLVTTYRCGKSIVAHAQRLVPDIVAAETNSDGTIDECDVPAMLQQAKPGDFILSRLNAPLVTVTLKLLRSGVRARMAGKSVGDEILGLLKRLKVNESTRLEDAVERIVRWRSKTANTQAALGLTDLVEKTNDQAEMLIELADASDDAADLLRRCEWLFTDESDDSQVLCSSVHKAKGLETDRVFVLVDTLYRRGYTRDEANIEYVAVTRAKHHLTLVKERV